MRQHHKNPILTYRPRLDAAAIRLVDDLRAELVERGLEVDVGGPPRPGAVWVDGDLHKGWTVLVHGGSYDNYLTIRPPRPKITGGFDTETWVVMLMLGVSRHRDPERREVVAEHHDDLAFVVGRTGFTCTREETSYDRDESIDGHLSDWGAVFDGPDGVVDALLRLLNLPLALHPDDEEAGAEPFALSTDEADLLLASGAPIEDHTPLPSYSSGLVATGAWRWRLPPSDVGAHRLVTPSGDLAATVYPASGWYVWSPHGLLAKSGSGLPVAAAKRQARTVARTWWRRKCWLP